jgi:hypothetical protein
MNINKSLKTKNKLAKTIADKQQLLLLHNAFRIADKDTLEYNTKTIAQELETDINDLVQIKTAIATANTPIWEKIFKMAELKGLISNLKGVPVKQGIDPGLVVYGRETKEVEWASHLTHTDIDTLVKKYEIEIETIQDELDKFNFTTEI